MNLHKLKDVQVIRALETHFAFRVKSVKRLSGFYDANFLIQTDQGRYFSKIYGGDTLPSIRFQLDFIEHLYAARIPVGKLIETNSKRNYFPLGKTYGIVQAFLPGKHLDESSIDARLLENIGAMLGTIHATTKGKRFKGKVWKKYLWDLSQFSMTAGNLPKAKKHLPDEVYQLCRNVRNDWKSERGKLDKLRKGVCHNDFHGKNLLVEGNRVVGITDFGDSMRTWYAADIAGALMHLCFLNGRRPEANIQAFLKGYARHFALPASEKKFLPLLIRMRAYLVAVEITNQFGKTPPGMYRIFFKHAVEVLRFIDADSIK